MVDKFFNKVFTAMDHSQTVQTVSSLLGAQGGPTQPAQQTQLNDKTLCIIHKLKKTFFCEDCCFELCATCKEVHETGHAVKFVEESSKFVIEKFQGIQEDIKGVRKKVHEASNEDPSQFPIPEGQVDVLEQGNKEIDYIFEKIQVHIENTKKEMKERLKDSYKANYRATIDSKSQNFLIQLDKLEGYVNGCLKDFQRLEDKGKHVKICYQRPKVDELNTNIEKFNGAFSRMCETSREFKNDFQIQFKKTDFDNNFKGLVNQHVTVSFPGLEHGFFSEIKRMPSLQEKKSYTYDKQEQQQKQQPQISKAQSIKQSSQVEFDPIKSLEKEEYDIRKAKEYPKIQPQAMSKPIIQVDSKYELRTLKFKKEKFEVKTYDAQNRKGVPVDIIIPDSCKRIATRFFGYVNLGGKDLMMSGGQFVDDKTCSIDTYRIFTDDQLLEDVKSYMKVARMHHSMIYIQEKGIVLAIGGEDENGNLLNSCEQYNVKDNQWKMLNSLNYKGKNIGLCKFSLDLNKQIFVYAFGIKGIERIDVSKTPIDPKWEELNIKNHQQMFMAPLAFQFDNNVILICGGTDEKNSNQQDIIYFNPNTMVMEKAQNTQLSVCDKFLGGAMTQFVVNRIESKIFFCSDSFVHELEYGAKVGDVKFKCKANLY